MSRVFDGLGSVCYGLKVVWVSLMISVLAVAAALVAVAYSIPEFFIGNPVLPDGPNYVVTFLSVLGGAVAIVGKAYCLKVPEESRAGGLIFAALMLSGGGLAIQVTSQIPALADALRSIAPTGGLFAMLGYFTFLGFLRRVCEFINAPGLSRAVAGLQTGSLLALALIFVAVSQAAQAGGRPSPSTVFLVLFGGILALVLIGRYAMLLIRVRKAIEHQMNRAFEEYESR